VTERSKLEDLTANERAQLDKAVLESDGGTKEWVTLMWMVTTTSSDNGDAFQRRQAVRELYAQEVASAMTSEPCEHQEQFERARLEGTALYAAVSLEHFDRCLNPLGRLAVWEQLQEMGDRSGMCVRANHDGLLDELEWAHGRIVELEREFAGRPRRKAARAAYRARRRTRRKR